MPIFAEAVREPDVQRSPATNVPKGGQQPASEQHPLLQRRAQQQLVQRRARVVQRHCACGGSCSTCSAATGPALEEKKRTVQLQRAPGVGRSGDAPALDDDSLIPRTSPGAPLDPATRERMESRFGAGFGDVRIHTDRAAGEAAERMGADAFTSGRDVYFATGSYAPATAQGEHLLAHELTHTLQQAEGAAPGVAAHARDGTAIGAADDPLEAEADRVAGRVAPGAGGGRTGHSTTPVTADTKPGTVRRNWVTKAAGAVSHAAGAAWDATGGRAVHLVEEGIDAVEDWAIGKLEEYAPGLLQFLRSDPIEYLKDRIGSAFDGLFGGMFARIQRDGLLGALEGVFGDLFGSIGRGVASLAGKACTAIAGVAGEIFDFLRAIGGAAFDALKKGASAVSSFFSDLWINYGAPAWDAIKRFAGSVWTWIVDKATWIWDKTKPVRDWFARAWSWLKRQFNLAWDTGAGILDWIKEKAAKAWGWIKEKIEPIIGPLKVVAAILIAISPIGPIVAIVAAAPYVWRALRWVWNNWGADVLVRARRVLQEDILPALQSGLQTAQSLLTAAAGWLREKTAALVSAIAALSDALGVSAFLAALRRGVIWLAEQAGKLARWVVDKFVRLATAVGSVLAAIWHYIQPFVVVLAKYTIAVGNPILFPILVASWAWLLLPDCFKPPIIDFLLDLMIGVVNAIPAFKSFGETWAKVRETILGELRKVRRAPVERKIAVANNVADMIGGPGLDGFSNLFAAARMMPSMFVGQAEEELIGMDRAAPLPFERDPNAVSSAGAVPALALAGGGGMPPELANVLGRTTFGADDVGVTEAPHLTLEPELLQTLDLHDGEERMLGERNEPGRSLQDIQAELGGAPPAMGAGQGAAPASASAGQALTSDEELEQILANQPPLECNAPAPAAGERATSEAVPEAMKRGPFTPSQRGHFMWEQMKRGMSQWYQCHKTAIIASLIAGLVVLVVAAILTGGAIFEAIPPLMEIIGAIMIGAAIVRVAGYVAEYVGKAATGDVPGAARSLARGLAVGAIELIFALLFNLGDVIKALKGGVKGTLEAVERATSRIVPGVVHSFERLGQVGVKAGRNTVTSLARLGRVFTRGGRVMFEGLERGFGRGIRSIGEFVEGVFERIRIRRLKVVRVGTHLQFWAEINPWILLADASLVEVSTIAAEARAGDRITTEAGTGVVVALGKDLPEELAQARAGERALAQTEGWVRPKGHRMPRASAENGEWLGKRGQSPFQSNVPEVNAITGGEPVPFIDGEPVFTKWAQGKPIEFEPGRLTGDEKHDLDLFDERFALERGFPNKTAAKKWRLDQRLTPHHARDGKTMELIPMDLHGIVRHSGGAIKLRRRR
jgi:Domain of unknown function (DUF4157)/A nuclease of the HNH/ENDO VII superfamily with conserved WHH